ncbi:glycosyltransferase family 2 protein [Thalassovita sp.]|jgi:glycosyltransferase involved in cell wall biosynthesis|uniref:glycosyltransferase family 2 protein n=1 Tax=Thalassovita sp. TaxID=1979401 RepID=UPI003B5CC873
MTRPTPSDSQPWLSVVMPVFNGARTLEASLTSLARNPGDIEVIVVDQGSTDDSLQIIDSFRERLSLRVFQKPQHQNWMQNTNFGFAAARAPFATMLHQDDIWLAGRLALLKRMYEKAPQAVLWVHGAHYIDAAGQKVGSIGPPFGRRENLLNPEQSIPRLIVQNTIALPAAMFKTRDVQGANGLDETLWYTADWDLWLRLAANGLVAWSPVAAVGFRLHQGSQTITGSRDAKAFAQQLALPVLRHADGMPKAVLKRAAASNALNVWLAKRYHKNAAPFAPVAKQLWRLGPRGWVGFLSDTRILQRILARLRVRL